MAKGSGRRASGPCGGTAPSDDPVRTVVEPLSESTQPFERFVQVVTALAGLPIRPATRRELKTFFETYGPLPEELCRIGTEHAIRLHGRRRHPRVYLQAIRTLVLAHWRTPNKENP